MTTQRNTFLLLLSMLASGLCSTASAQNELKNARFGFKASPNFNWVKMMEGRMENNGTALGFSYGIMGDFNIGGNPAYWLSAEVIISSVPGKIASMDTLYNSSIVPPNSTAFTNAQFDYKLQYVQIPLALKLKTNEIGKFMYWGQFGLSPAILMQNKVTTNTQEPFYKSGVTSHSPNSNNNDPLDFDGITNNNATTGRFIDDVSPLRMSMILGAGIEFRVSGKTTVVAGIRFDNGFMDMFRDGGTKARNNYLGIHTGVFF